VLLGGARRNGRCLLPPHRCHSQLFFIFLNNNKFINPTGGKNKLWNKNGSVDATTYTSALEAPG
jgi:hypothetical protein